MITKIDLDHWDRKEHYLFFRRSDYAHYHIGCDLDITHFKAAAKSQGIPFSFAMTYAATESMNKVEAFRYRILDGDVILHDRLHPYFSYIAPDKKYFKMVLGEIHSDMKSFADLARKKALSQPQYFIREDTLGRSDLIFISSIPNVSFTHLSHTITMSNPDDAIPRLSWGKYFERDNQLLLPFNIQAHHAFVDGDHMGHFIDHIQDYLNSFE